MKRIKGIVALLLMLVMVLSLSGCGKPEYDTCQLVKNDDGTYTLTDMKMNKEKSYAVYPITDELNDGFEVKDGIGKKKIANSKVIDPFIGVTYNFEGYDASTKSLKVKVQLTVEPFTKIWIDEELGLFMMYKTSEYNDDITLIIGTEDEIAFMSYDLSAKNTTDKPTLKVGHGDTVVVSMNSYVSKDNINISPVTFSIYLGGQYGYSILLEKEITL